MNNPETLLAMIATEAAEDHVEFTTPSNKVEPKMEYPLELVRQLDGSLLWVE